MKKLSAWCLALLLLVTLPVTVCAAETVDSVSAMIAELPTVEAFTAMDADAQLEAYNRTQQAYDAYMALSEEEKAQISGAEKTFEALFSHFNTLVMPIEQADAAPAPTEEARPTGKVGYNGYAWLVIVLLVAALAILVVKRKK